MNTKTLYRLYHIESNSISLVETDYSQWGSDYIRLGEIGIQYDERIQTQDKMIIEPLLEEARRKALAKAQLIQDRIDTMRCIDYKPMHNASPEGEVYDTGRENQQDEGTA